MNSQIKQILKLNNKFYQSVSKEFTVSRQYPWKGWERVLSIFLNLHKDDSNLKILDMGCGNGRFSGYLKNKLRSFSYKGYDTNNDLLSEAKRKYISYSDKKFKFINKNILGNKLRLKRKYDLVVCFGLTHHIPNANYRFAWLSALANIVRKNGVIALTFWKFEKKPGDYLVSWGDKKIPRYCHQYSDYEIKKITTLFTKKGLRLLDKYISDKDNTYLIFGNI